MISLVGVRQYFLGSGGRGHRVRQPPNCGRPQEALPGSGPQLSHLHRELLDSERLWPFLLCSASV